MTQTMMGKDSLAQIGKQVTAIHTCGGAIEEIMDTAFRFEVGKSMEKISKNYTQPIFCHSFIIFFLVFSTSQQQI